jgi:hypothetical protein
MTKKSGTVYIHQEFSKKKPENLTKVLSKKTKKTGLNNLVEQSKQIIFEARSIFPFDLFPNRITICLDKIIINYRDLFGRDQYALLLENVVGARITHSPFFASLHIETFGIKDSPTPISYLKSLDARLARRYILALLECKKAEIDLAGYDIEYIRDKLKKLGKVREGKIIS